MKYKATIFDLGGTLVRSASWFDYAEAAAASATALMGIIPNELIINRPFIFLIRDIETGSTLFIGRVLNPSA